MNWLAIVAVGAAVGFLGGVFGKGGAAVATPLLAAFGVPPFIAVAAPLPATVPSTVVASWAYWRHRLVDPTVVAWSLGIGIPATVVGALASQLVDGHALVVATDVVVAGLGLRFVLARHPVSELDGEALSRRRLIAVAAVTGLAAGLLANSGGFLLAPLYVAVLGLPIKQAFACSLAVSAVLAVPGTVVHTALGHVDWRVVLVFGAASVPLSYVGARVAIRADALRLERVYGAALLILGVTLFVLR